MNKSNQAAFSADYVGSQPVISEVSRMPTHLLTDDFVVETQIAGGGSADLSSSIWAREKNSKRLKDSTHLWMHKHTHSCTHVKPQSGHFWFYVEEI